MKKLFGFLVFTAGYGMVWWSYEALSGRVPGTPESNTFLPSLKDLFVPGRLAPNKLGAPPPNKPGSVIQQVTNKALFGTGIVGETLAFGPNLIHKLFG